MTQQAADHRKKAEEHYEQTAHQHKQPRRAMRRTNEKRGASYPPRARHSLWAINHGIDAGKSDVGMHENKERNHEERSV